MEENRTTVLIRIERTLRDRLMQMAGPRWEYYKDGPKEPIGAVIQRLADKVASSRGDKPRGRRRRRAVNRTRIRRG